MISQKKLLVVDDSADFRRLLVEELRSHFYEVEEARSGLEAIQLILSSPTSWMAILMDYPVPTGSGAQLIKAVRPRCPDLPFIIIAGISHLAPVEILSVPFRHTDLIEILSVIRSRQ